MFSPRAPLQPQIKQQKSKLCLVGVGEHYLFKINIVVIYMQRSRISWSNSLALWVSSEHDFLTLIYYKLLLLLSNATAVEQPHFPLFIPKRIECLHILTCHQFRSLFVNDLLMCAVWNDNQSKQSMQMILDSNSADNGRWAVFRNANNILRDSAWWYEMKYDASHININTSTHQNWTQR